MNNQQGKAKGRTCGIFRSVSGGLLLAFLSGVMFSFTSLIVKYLRNIHPSQLFLYRSFAVTAMNLPSLVLTGNNFFGPPGFRVSVAAVGIFAAVSMFLQFLCFKYLPLGEASVIICSYPVFVSVAARIFLKEPFGLLHVISLLTTILGMALTTGVIQTFLQKSRTYTTENMYGFAIAFSSLIFNTGKFIYTRKLRRLHYSIPGISAGYMGFIASSVAVPITGGTTMPYCGLQQQILIIILGIVTYLAILGMVLSLKYAEAGAVTIMRASGDILFSFAWQVLVFGDQPDGITILGASLVLISVIILSRRKQINNLFAGNCKKRH